MTKKDKFGDFFGRSEGTKPKAKKPIGFFEATPAPVSKDEAKQQTAKPFFATPEEAQQEREERERQKEQRLEKKRQLKQRKLEELKAYKLRKAKEKKDKAFIREQEKIIAREKREDAKAAARDKKYGYTPRGTRFYSTEMRQEALDNFKKYGTTKRPLQPNHAMVRKVLDIYAQIEL